MRVISILRTCDYITILARVPGGTGAGVLVSSGAILTCCRVFTGGTTASCKQAILIVFHFCHPRNKGLQSTLIFFPTLL